MPPSHQQPARLTKKQKKATAFRERGSKLKGKGKQQPNNPAPGRSRPSLTTTRDNGEYADDDDNDDDLGEANAIPALEDEDQALAAMAGDAEGDAKGDAKGRAAARVPKIAVESTATQNKNRKKRGREDGEAQPGAAKKARLARRSKEIPPPEGEGAASVNAVNDGEDGDGSKTNNKESKTQRYILFIGNLKYTTTREAIQNHFSQCDPPPTVRLLTLKATRAGATTVAKSKKSKGCAFLEFTTRPALQAALRLHQSELEGRRINVELTAGGGGKSDARLAKVKARNKLLSAQRTRQTVKGATAQGKDAVQHEHLQPQRFSTTSGEGDVPRTKRTWTVGDDDQGGEHRGRTKAGKKRGTRTKNWGTGVNALPIG
ncbi:hypothetical protein DFH94DRAFT_852615 [Russula ochroleuca]|uniref:RRM domain-containing protein n=1 Tax=Russula ochroleuca TaxID=152965 RepID=A0A9P5TAF7_9AGAM|nr:hypothetical protein DFH94DRAFT_852615 [Russula ochroleuca]